MALIKVKTGGVDSTVNLGRRNMIINGAMQVAQRGTSAAGLTNGSNGCVTVDRFRFVEQGTPTYVLTATQSTDAPSGFANSFKFEITTAQSSLAAADILSIDTILEAQDVQRLGYGTASAKEATLSFWVKSNVTGTYVVWLYQYDDARGMTKSWTIDAANTWEYKTVAIPADATGVIDNNNGAGLVMRWILGAGTDYTSGTASPVWIANVDANRHVGQGVNVADTIGNTFQITGVQLEVGDTATPFEHRSYGEELSLCQRYFQKISGGSDAFTVSAKGQGSASVDATIPLTVPLRTSPTMNSINSRTFNDAGYFASSSTTPTVLQYSDNNTLLAVNCGGFSGLVNNEIQNWGPVSNTLTIDAEL